MLAVQEMATEWATGATPLPWIGTVSKGVLLADSAKLPLTAPATVGKKLIWALTLCPAFKVRGVVRPVLKPAPVRLS